MTDPFLPPSAGQPAAPYGGPAYPAPAPAPPLYGAPQYGAPYGSPYGPPTTARNGLGVAALVLGIIAVLLSWVPFLGLLLGTLAIVFAVLGRRRVSRHQADNGGVAVAGLVTGIVALVFCAIATTVFIMFAEEITDFSRCLNDAAGDPVAEQVCADQFTDRIRG